MYWRDSGLLHSLLGGPSETALLDQPWGDARKRILISRTPRSVASDREISCSLPWFLQHALDAPAPRGFDRA